MAAEEEKALAGGPEAEALTRSLELTNRFGLHARCAAKIVKLVQETSSQVFFSKDGQKVDASSIISLLTLNCPKGSKVEIEVRGKDAAELLAKLSELFDRNFDED